MSTYLYRKSLDTYGLSSQLDQTIEECAELTIAIRHYKRGRCTIEDLAAEMADVEIMLEQMRLVYGPQIDAAKEIKLVRLEERLLVGAALTEFFALVCAYEQGYAAKEIKLARPVERLL